MARQKGVLAAVFFAFMALAMLPGSANAAEEKVDLKGDYWKMAKGEAIIKDAAEGQKEISVEASGLLPNSVYSLWFVRDEPEQDMAGVGTGDFSFKSDERGNASYNATVPSAEIENWDKLEVAYHPDGDPANIEGHKTALEADLSEAEERG